MKQLSFENLPKKQDRPAVNITAPKADEKRLGRQALAIYNHLRAGPVWVSQMVLIARQYNSRIKEIRDWLSKEGLTIDLVDKKANGDTCYVIRPFYGSNYQRYLMKKNQKAPAASERNK